jgi:hypothetical protein
MAWNIESNNNEDNIFNYLNVCRRRLFDPAPRDAASRALTPVPATDCGAICRGSVVSATNRCNSPSLIIVRPSTQVG